MFKRKMILAVSSIFSILAIMASPVGAAPANQNINNPGMNSPMLYKTIQKTYKFYEGESIPSKIWYTDTQGYAGYLYRTVSYYGSGGTETVVYKGEIRQN